MIVERRQTSYQSNLSQFLLKRISRTFHLSHKPSPTFSQLHFDTVGIAKLLNNLNVKRPLAQIKFWVLKNTAQEIAPFLQRFFSLSLQIGDVPQDWEKANIHAIFKSHLP